MMTKMLIIEVTEMIMQRKQVNSDKSDNYKRSIFSEIMLLFPTHLYLFPKMIYAQYKSDEYPPSMHVVWIKG